ncbi:MAG TPA: multidrug ABC transporter permease [Thermoplasmatales archaeon]|nr:multidrug ABC transporter permease [Thermoplasmatales archaeon]
MKKTEMQAIYVMWLRQMKRFIRSKSRITAMIVQPLFFLVILGLGLRSAILPGMSGDYVTFIAPGIVAMTILFSSMFTGVSVLWDKQFGFLQEVLVAPISRFSIIVGRTLGGATVALIQGFIILFIAVGIGIPTSDVFGLMSTLVFMVLTAFTAVGFGLVLASKMQDFQGFQIIMNLLIMPLLFLSSVFFPIASNPEMPDIIVKISYLNPMFYMVDGIRGSLTGINNVLHPLIDLVVVLIICVVMLGLGSYFFSKSEV